MASLPSFQPGSGYPRAVVAVVERKQKVTETMRTSLEALAVLHSEKASVVLELVQHSEGTQSMQQDLDPSDKV